MQPLVPGFVIAGELSSTAIGSTWVAVRSRDGCRLVLRIIPVPDATQAQVQACHATSVLATLDNDHLVRQHGGIILADGTFALVLDETTGGSLARVLGARGQLSPGETVTTLAPLFGALADLHAVGVVHGDLTPGNVLFSPDGRPLIGELGMSRLLGRHAGSLDGTSGFVAPEVADGAAPSSASDVYAMAALGWFCLAGAPPDPAAFGPSLATLRPETPALLVDLITSCLSIDPARRPSAGAAAIEAFDAAPAEPVALTWAADPAGEITRRIRVAAAAACAMPPPARSRLRDPRVIAMALLVLVALGGGTTWLLHRPPAHPVGGRSMAPRPSVTTAIAQPLMTAAALPMATKVAPDPVTPAQRTRTRPGTTPQRVTDVVTAPDSPRIATTALLQALVDARALAYGARSPALLDLVYAPGATMARADQANIATALKNGGTYLGLSFVVKDVAFLDGTTATARIRATILTPGYATGQPDGRNVSHAEDVVGPSVFSLSLTSDGWRIRALRAS